MPNGCQNGTKIDAKTHQNSMPKQASKKIRTIIKNNVSLKGKFIENHWKNNGFVMFQKGACANGNGTPKTSKMRPTSIHKSMTNRYKNYIQRSDARIKENHLKLNPKGSQKPSQNNQTSVRKKYRFVRDFSKNAGWTFCPIRLFKINKTH